MPTWTTGLQTCLGQIPLLCTITGFATYWGLASQSTNFKYKLSVYDAISGTVVYTTSSSLLTILIFRISTVAYASMKDVAFDQAQETTSRALLKARKDSYESAILDQYSEQVPCLSEALQMLEKLVTLRTLGQVIPDLDSITVDTGTF